MITEVYYPPTQNGLQKTLDANLLTGVTASATLNNVTGIQNKKGIMVIDRVDSNNKLTPNKREFISFDGTSGSTVVTLVRGLGGSTDQDHAVGAIVEFVNDVVQQEAILAELEAINAAIPTKASGAEINSGINDTKFVTPKAITDSKVSLSEKVETLKNKTVISQIVNTTNVAQPQSNRQIIARDNGSDVCGMFFTKISFANLGTTPQNVFGENGGSGIFQCFLQNIDGDRANFTLSVGIEAGVVWKAVHIAGANCSITRSAGNVFDITGLGDGRTYTITITDGSGGWTIKASSTATGNTILTVCGLTI